MLAGCPEVVVAGLLAGVDVVAAVGFDASMVELGAYDCLQIAQEFTVFSLSFGFQSMCGTQFPWR